jgi:methylase of polypeptide subunit release factors
MSTMEYQKFSAHLDLAKFYWKTHIKQGDMAIDATCGNGHDSLFLAQLPLSILFSIDIQPEAIESTKNLLEKHEVLHKVSLHCQNHNSFEKLPLTSSLKLIVYNLGYLPGKDKTLTTQTASTLTSLQAALLILGKGGALSITCYPGHLEGEKEQEAILSWAKSLDPKKWLICHHQWVNRYRAPSLFWISNLASSII